MKGYAGGQQAQNRTRTAAGFPPSGVVGAASCSGGGRGVSDAALLLPLLFPSLVVLSLDSEPYQSYGAVESEPLGKSISHALAGRATLRLRVTEVMWRH